MANPFVNPNAMKMPPQRMLLQQMVAQNPQLQAMFNMLQNGGNPQQILQNFMAQNPQARNVMAQMQNSGMNAEQYVRTLAKQYNVDIEPMIQSFRNKGFR